MEKQINHLAVLIASVHRSIQRIKSSALAEYGMSSIHAMCIYSTGINPGISAAEICKSNAIDKAAVSKALKDLIQDGYLERNILAKRAYRSGIYLTKAGENLFAIVNAKIEKISQIALQELKDKEYEAILRTLNRISSNLETLD